MLINIVLCTYMTEESDFFSTPLDEYLCERICRDLKFETMPTILESKHISSMYLFPYKIPILYQYIPNGYRDKLLELLIAEIKIPHLRKALIENYEEFDNNYSDVNIYFDAEAFAKTIGAEPFSAEYWVESCFISPMHVKTYSDFDNLMLVKKGTHPETYINPFFERFCLERILKEELYVYTSSDGCISYNSFSAKIPAPDKYLFSLDAINELMQDIAILDNDKKHDFSQIKKYKLYFDTSARIKQLIMKHKFTYFSNAVSHASELDDEQSQSET